MIRCSSRICRPLPGPGVKNANGADAWAAFPDLTPDLVEEWVVPYSKNSVSSARKSLG